MRSGAGANDNGNGETGNSDENSSAPQLQKSDTNAKILDEGHVTGKGYLQWGPGRGHACHPP